MDIKRVWAVYFSPVGGTAAAVCAAAEAAAAELSLPVKKIDFTLPAAREEVAAFEPTDLVFFAVRHVFSDTLGAGRPDAEDTAQMQSFGRDCGRKAAALTEITAPIQVSGDAAAPYYVPKGVDGQPAKFLPAKPLTDAAKCVGCGTCAAVCPVASIDPKDVANVPGICIKCHACVRRCPTGAKYFADPAFLSHKAMLEQNFQRPAESAVFI